MITEKELRAAIKNSRRMVGEVQKGECSDWQFLLLSNTFLGEPKTHFIKSLSYKSAVHVRTMYVVQKALAILGFPEVETAIALGKRCEIKPYTATKVVRTIIREHFKL